MSDVVLKRKDGTTHTFTGVNAVRMKDLSGEFANKFIIPNGTKSITENGTHDIAEYEAVTVDIHDIIDVDELPTSDIDTSKYYRMGDALYKVKNTAVGTWLLNESLNSDSGIYAEVDISVTFSSLSFVVFAFSTTGAGARSLSIGANDSTLYPTRLVYYGTGTGYHDVSLSGRYVQIRSGSSSTVDYSYDKTVEYRTITITGGTDAENPDLISWLNSNATRQGDLWDKYYIPTFQTKTVTENGEVAPDDGYDGLSQITVNVPIPSGYIVPSGTKSIELTSPLSAEFDVTEYEKVSAIAKIQDKRIEITSNGETVVARDNGYAGMDNVYLTVNVPALDTSDATASADKMLESYTAYVDGKKVTGTIPTYEGDTTISPVTAFKEGTTYSPDVHWSDIYFNLWADESEAKSVLATLPTVTISGLTGYLMGVYQNSEGAYCVLSFDVESLEFNIAYYSADLTEWLGGATVRLPSGDIIISRETFDVVCQAFGCVKDNAFYIPLTSFAGYEVGTNNEDIKNIISATPFVWTSNKTLSSATPSVEGNILTASYRENASAYAVYVDDNKVTEVPYIDMLNGYDLTQTGITEAGTHKVRVQTISNNEYFTDSSLSVAANWTIEDGGSNLITFYFRGTSYQAEEGMTWAQFIDSSYNDGTFSRGEKFGGTIYYVNRNGKKVTCDTLSDQAGSRCYTYTDETIADGYYYSHTTGPVAS